MAAFVQRCEQKHNKKLLTAALHHCTSNMRKEMSELGDERDRLGTLNLYNTK